MAIPRITTRHDGWTAPRRQLFLEQLRATGRIPLAAAPQLRTFTRDMT